MALVKKLFTVILFVSLIASFVLYRMDFFDKTSREVKPNPIITNFFEPLPDSLSVKKKLIVDYYLVLKVDTLNLAFEKRILKKFRLIEEVKRERTFSSSKSAAPLIMPNKPTDISKDESILKKFKELNVVAIDFSLSGHLDVDPLDADLLYAIDAIENNELILNSEISYYLDYDDMVDLYWKKYWLYPVSIYLSDNYLTYVGGFQVDNFFKWYEEFNDNRVKKKVTFSSSKSLVTTDKMHSLILEDFKENKALFIEKLKEYLNIKL